MKFHFQNNYNVEFIKKAKKSRCLNKININFFKSKKVKNIIKRDSHANNKKCFKLIYKFIYQIAK
jgi:hypothetical protein